jgi:hypothetical protein
MRESSCMCLVGNRAYLYAGIGSRALNDFCVLDPVKY